MRLNHFTPLLLALILFTPWLATAQTPDVKSDLAANAALQYWQAFTQMPTLDKDQEQLLQQWQTASLVDPGVQKLIADSQNSLMYLQRASALPRCDWGLDYNDGMGLLLLHLAKGRELARFAALHGRQELERRNPGGAQSDAKAILVMGRHVGRDATLVSILVRYAIEGVAIDLLAPFVPEMKASYSQFVAMYDGLPPAATLRQAMDIESRYMIQWAIKKMKEEEQREKGGGLKLWRSFMDGPEIPDTVKQIPSFDTVLKLTEDLVPLPGQIANLLALPNDQFDAQYATFIEKAKAANPVAGITLPAVGKVRAKEQQHQARTAMLLAGIAVAEGGVGKLKEIKDPFGAGPFEYQPLDKGFELKSKLMFEGQPVTLKIGR